MNRPKEFVARVMPIAPLEACFHDAPHARGRITDLSSSWVRIEGLFARVGECRTIIVSSNNGLNQHWQLKAVCKWSRNGDPMGCSGFEISAESLDEFSRLRRAAADIQPHLSSSSLKDAILETTPCATCESASPKNYFMFQKPTDSRSRFKRVLGDYISFRRTALYLLILWDLLGIAISVWVAYSLSPAHYVTTATHLNSMDTVLVIIVCFPLVALLCGLYERETFVLMPYLLIYCVLAAFLLWSAALAFNYVAFFSLPGRWIAGTGFLVSMASLISGRLIFRSNLIRRPIRVLFLGDDNERQHLQQNIEARRLKDLILVADHSQSSECVSGKTAKSAFDNSGIHTHTVFDWLVVSSESCRDLNSLILDSLARGIRVDNTVSFLEDNFLRTPAELIDIQWLVDADKRLLWNLNRVFKRSVDVVVSVIAIVVSSPIVILGGLMIKMNDRGPILFKQTRVGRHGTHFEIVKLRTMHTDAERLNGAQWAVQEDPRVTTVGRWLRRMRIDEFPQFLNVIRGDMSIVGPRPERPEFVGILRESIPNYELRHLVRPGITGWAQIKYRYGSTVEEAKKKLSYDLYYIKYGTVLFDLYVMLRTFLFFVRGAR